MRVPVYEPNVNTAQLPGVRYNDVPDAAAFGGATARAAQTAGLQVAGTGNDMIALAMNMKRDNDTLAAKEAYLQFKNESREFLWNDKTGIFARQGLNAQTSMEDTDQFFADAAERHAENLNGSQRGMFNSFVMQDRDNTMDSVASHKHQQLSIHQDSQDLALIENTVNDAGLNYNNPDIIATAKLNMNHALDSNMQRHGDISIDKDGNAIEGGKTKALRMAYLTKINSSVIASALANNDFEYARNYLKETSDKKEFTADEQAKWTATIKERADYTDIRKIIDMNSDPEMATKLQERDEEGNFVNFAGKNEGGLNISDHNRDVLAKYAQDKYNDYSTQTMKDMTARSVTEIIDPEEVTASGLNNQDKQRMFSLIELQLKNLNNASTPDGKLIYDAADKKEQIYETKWSLDDSERLAQVAQMKREIHDMGLDAKERVTLGEYVDKVSKEHLTLSQNPVWEQGHKLIIAANKAGKMFLDPPGWTSNRDDKIYQQEKLAETNIWWNSYFKTHPDLEPDKVTELIQARLKGINDGTVIKNLQDEFAPKTGSSLGTSGSWGKPNTSVAVNLSTPSNKPRIIVRKGLLPDGRMAVKYSDGTKEVNP